MKVFNMRRSFYENKCKSCPYNQSNHCLSLDDDLENVNEEACLIEMSPVDRATDLWLKGRLDIDNDLIFNYEYDDYMYEDDEY